MNNFRLASYASALTTLCLPLVASATLTPSLSRGVETVTINAPGGSSICVIPTKFGTENYSSKDMETEKELCGMVEDETAAVCPKLSSTNPGVEFYKVPAGMTAKQVSAQNCTSIDPATKKNRYSRQAKYKYSLSCSYTPSILAYYHISRALGGAADVPPTVLRTFDFGRHLEIAKLGVSITEKQMPGEIINQTWEGVLAHLKAGQQSSKVDAIFTDGITHTYGALSKDPKGEEKYSETYNGGKDQPTRFANFKANNVIYKFLSDARPISAQIGTKFDAANAQKMTQLIDVADMIVLDTILAQQDRFGNIHYVMKYVYLDKSKLDPRGLPSFKDEKTDDAAKVAALKSQGAQLVKKLVLKDNDCGINRENLARKTSLLEGISHISPTTYRKLMILNKTADNEGVKKAFKLGMMFTEKDYVNVRANIAHAAQVLQSRCKAGKLKLDLDPGSHFTGIAVQNSCD